MAKLDLRHLKKFCYAHDRQGLWVFIESYLFRDHAALYHISNIRERLEAAKQPQPSYIQKVYKTEIELPFEVDALMLTLNSMIDLALQIINEAFLSSPKKPEDLRWKDWDKLKKSPGFPSKVAELIDSLRDHPTKQKIREYSNISKHIRVIRGQLTIDFRPHTPQTDYTTAVFGFKKRITLDVDDLEECRKFTKETVKSLITLVDITLGSAD